MDDFIQVGLNHLSVPIQFRERLVRGEKSLEDSLDELRRFTGLDEIVLLSTCSRFEVFAAARDPIEARRKIFDWFRQAGGEDIEQYLRSHSGPGAIRHLFRVAAGLESWILGESEILGQVKKAYQLALAAGFTRRLTNRVFQDGIAAGKRARARTGLQDGIHSIGGAAALLARGIFGEERRGMALVFGAGEAAEAVCRHLAVKNFADLLVANRTVEHAEELARKVGGKGVSFEEGLLRLGDVEAAIFSTSASRPIIEAAWLARRIAGRGKSLFLIDLGLPRNVAPECADLPGVYVYDLDDLKGVVARSMTGKADAESQAGVLIEDAVVECLRQVDKAQALCSAGMLRSA